MAGRWAVDLYYATVHLLNRSTAIVSISLSSIPVVSSGSMEILYIVIISSISSTTPLSTLSLSVVPPDECSELSSSVFFKASLADSGKFFQTKVFASQNLCF